MKKFLLLLLMLFLAACGARQAQLSPQTTAQLPTSTTASATTTLKSTVAPSPQPTTTPIAVPSLVWLPLEHSSQAHDNKVLTVRDGKGSFEQTPVDIGTFWDYTALTGRLAYASQTKHADSRSGTWSVSDLWVYNYTTGKTEMWLPNDVAHAAWSPVIDSKTSKQNLAAVLYNSTLVVLTAPNEITTLSENASINFAWSPDGRSVAYIKNGGLFIITVDKGQTRQISNVLIDSAWIGDKPIWMPEQQALIYTKAPVEIATLDGSMVFTPKTPDGQSPEVGRAGNILWSSEKRILAFDVGIIGGSTIWVYELSPDLETIVNNYSFYRTEGEPIAAWWVSGESILLRTGEIWSISKKTIVDTIR